MTKYPSENRLKLAGWLSIANGLGPFPSNAILVFALFSENPPLTVAAVGVQVGLTVAAFFVYFTFIRLLNGPFGFRGVNLILWLLIGILGIEALFGFPTRLTFFRELLVTIDVRWIYFSISIVSPLLYVMLGVRLRVLWAKLPATRILSIASWGMGFLSLLYSLTRWIPGLMSITSRLTFLVKGIFYISLALVFFEASRLARSGWQTPSADSELQTDGKI